MSSIGLSAPRLAGGTICYLAEVIGAIFLILGYGAGLYIAAIAIIVLFGFLISGAWLLMIGGYEDQAKDDSHGAIVDLERESKEARERTDNSSN